VASWASLDYFGRWKALHYAAKRFYAPLLLSVAEEGKTMKVHVTSDLVEPVDVIVRWRLETLDGKNLDSGEQSLRAMALADTRVGIYDFATLVSAENQRKVVFVAEMWGGGQLVSHSVTPFVSNKHIELRKPGLKVQSRVEDKTLCIDVSTRYLARFVELSIRRAARCSATISMSRLERLSRSALRYLRTGLQKARFRRDHWHRSVQ
jgi:beta-mannosidase